MATQNFAINKQGGNTPIKNWDVDDLIAAINLLAFLQTGGTLTGNLIMADGTNIIINATTGSQIGTAITQKLAFYGSTPVVQRANAAQAAAPAGGVGTLLGAYDTSANRDAMINLVNEMRTVLVSLGLMKGAA